jgi:hypothetical protein
LHDTIKFFKNNNFLKKLKIHAKKKKNKTKTTTTTTTTTNESEQTQAITRSKKIHSRIR